jgi:hypothetical protein
MSVCPGKVAYPRSLAPSRASRRLPICSPLPLAASHEQRRDDGLVEHETGEQHEPGHDRPDEQERNPGRYQRRPEGEVQARAKR